MVDPENERALAIAATAKGQLADQEKDEKKKQELRASALADVAKLVAKHPDDLRLKWLQESLANPDMPKEKRFEAVISQLSDPYDQDIAWVQYYVQAKDPAKQLEYLKKAALVRDTAEGPVDAIFQLALSMKNWDLADEYAQKAAQLNIDGVHGKLYQGRLMLAKGDKAQALQTLQQAVSERPGFSMAHTTLAMAYLEMGQQGQAHQRAEHRGGADAQQCLGAQGDHRHSRVASRFGQPGAGAEQPGGGVTVCAERSGVEGIPGPDRGPAGGDPHPHAGLRAESEGL